MLSKCSVVSILHKLCTLLPTDRGHYVHHLYLREQAAQNHHLSKLWREFCLQDLSETFTTSCANGQFELEESVEAMLEVIKAVNDSLHQINIKVSHHQGF